MENISVQQASGWWGLLFSMAERQLSWMSMLSPTAFQFADTLGTTLLCSSNKDGFQPSRAVLSAEEEKAVVGECTVWGVDSVGCVQCGVCAVWGVYSVGCVQCGVCAVWGVYSVRCLCYI